MFTVHTLDFKVNTVNIYFYEISPWKFKRKIDSKCL